MISKSPASTLLAYICT